MCTGPESTVRASPCEPMCHASWDAWNTMHQATALRLTQPMNPGHNELKRRSYTEPVHAVPLSMQWPCYTHLDAQIVLSHNVLLPGVELGTLVHECAACLASNRHRKHHAHFHIICLGTFVAWQGRRIKVRRVILVEHFTLTHFARLL